MKTLTSLLLTLVAATIFAVDLPPLEFPQGVGVNIHFTRGHGRDLDLMAAAGFKFIRMDFGWGGIERRKGEYDWSAYDDLTADLEKRGMRAIYIFDYSNGLYEDSTSSSNPITGRVQRDTASPHKPESVAAFAKWAAAAAAHFKGKRIVWEIWNEPNISFWKPKPNAPDYATLALATCKAVRAADPDATIIAPGTSEFPWPFFETVFKAGALEHLDAVSVHPYRNYSKGPETAAKEYLRLRSVIERYAPVTKKAMPIISGEWGYASHTKGVSLETQAAFIARQQIANVWQGVPISIWYDWKNDGDDPSYNENNFGTVSNDLSLKPSYVAVQTLTRELGGYHIARRLEIGEKNDFVFLLLNKDRQQKLAAWTAAKPHNAALDLGLSAAADVSVVDGQGQPVAVAFDGGKLRIELKPAPQYITLRKTSRVLSAAAAWSVDGFVPTLVEAGSSAELRIPLKVTNPFTQPIQARLAVDSTAGAQSRAVTLRPGESRTETLSLKPRLRTADQTPYVINVAFTDKQQPSLPIGSFTEQREFFVSNPLAVSVAPVENAMRLLVQSPSGTAFSGTAIVNGRSMPVRLAAGSTETVLTTPLAGDSVTVQLIDGRKQPATEKVTHRFQSLGVAGLRYALDGDAKVSGTAQIAEGAAPAGETAPVSRVFKIDYSFESGWKFLRAIVANEKPVALPGDPLALGMWVFGDKSGNALRTRVTDAQGQTFQPTGPNLNWTGWRWVEFDLKNLSHAGHWGGANDGVAHSGLKLDTLLLVDGARSKTGGTIYLAGPALVY